MVLVETDVLLIENLDKGRQPPCNLCSTKQQGTLIIVLKGQCREILIVVFFMSSFNLIPVASVFQIFKFVEGSLLLTDVTCDKKLGDTLWLGKFGLVITQYPSSLFLTHFKSLAIC
jgi:hypothetical protein